MMMDNFADTYIYVNATMRVMAILDILNGIIFTRQKIIKSLKKFSTL
ncbi:hypothetical protein J2067_001919 [Erwinia rhapontici]|nr:hypothetical protein [Erwinia rhapontici]